MSWGGTTGAFLMADSKYQRGSAQDGDDTRRTRKKALYTYGLRFSFDIRVCGTLCGHWEISGGGRGAAL